MGKIAMITGATSGIGKATAFCFASIQWDVILIGRRNELLQKISEQLKHEFKVEVLTLNLDVSRRQDVEQAISGLPDDWQKIDVLVNNAGGAKGLSAFHNGNPDDWDWMIDVNLKGLIYMTHEVLKLMRKQGNGHIINIGSIAGREIYPNGNVYCAVKAAVDMLSKGLRIELLTEGIKVTHIAPGAAETEFSLVRFNGDHEKAAKVYHGYKPLSGDDVANAILYAATLPYEMNVGDIEVLPRSQGGTNFIHRSQLL